MTEGLDDVQEALAKLARRLDELEMSLSDERGLTRQIIDGRVGIRIAPVARQLARNVEETTTYSRFLDCLAGFIVAFAVIVGVVWYLADKPWPFSFYVPPPHSSELQKR